MKTILITGAQGFLGTFLFKELENKGYKTITLPKSVNILSPNALDCYAGKVDFVYHLAGKTYIPDSWESPKTFFETNSQGTLNVLEFCRKNNTGLHYVSAYIYGIQEKMPISEKSSLYPNNPYAMSKYIAEEYCKFYSQYYGVKVTISRPFNIFGPDQKEDFLIPQIIKQATTDKIIRVKSLSPKRDFIYVKDACEAIVNIATKEKTFQIYNLGSGIAYSVQEVINIVINELNEPIEVECENTNRKNEIPLVVSDITKLKERINWSPRYTFLEAITETIQKTTYKKKSIC